MISFLILFGNFYLQAYIKKKQSADAKKSKETTVHENGVSHATETSTEHVNGDTPGKSYNLRKRTRIEK